MHDLPSKSNCIPNKEIGSLGIAVIVTPAVALLAGGSATAAGTGGSSWQLVKTQEIIFLKALSLCYNAAIMKYGLRFANINNNNDNDDTPYRWAKHC